MSLWVAFCCLLWVAVLGVSAHAQPLSIRLGGVSTILFDDGETQILFDGYFSRISTSRKLTGRIAPDLKRIARGMETLGVLQSGCTVEAQSGDCLAAQETRLKAVIPFHGHYDHALDSPFVAAIAGADLIADTSVRRIWYASRAIARGTPLADRFSIERLVSLDGVLDDESLRYGAFTIKLFATPHYKPPFVSLAKGVTPAGTRFPVGAADLREGTSIGAVVSHGDVTVLLISSAGDPVDRVRDLEIDADLVLLGVSGTGLPGWSAYRKRYWRNTVVASCAETVIPIHWDRDSVPVVTGTDFIAGTEQQTFGTIEKYKALAAADSIRVWQPEPVVEHTVGPASAPVACSYPRK